MIIGGLVVIGAVATGHFIYHHFIVKGLQDKVTALQKVVGR